VRKILITGMSGTGKSTALTELRRRGFQVVDTPRFDAVVLLSAPAEVSLRRIENRTTNDYGKTVDERDLILGQIGDVEPLLRATCTHEIDATLPVDDVVRELIEIGEAATSR
jgi:thymidylate kinase